MDLDNTSIGPKVYIGTWVNWSRGSVMGSTLTITKQNGNLLIAFTAFFIGFLSSRAWRIISFALHQFYSTPTPRNALHHQRQAILRNSETAGWSFWTLGQVAWAWRRSVSWYRPLLVVLPALLFSTLCILFFAAASGFSSQISTAIGDEVLINGENCGMAVLDFTGGEIRESDAFIMGTASRQVSDAANYAQQCYSSPFESHGKEPPRSAGVSDCNSFIVPSLPRSIDTNAPCPFADGICRTNSSNLLLDTGYIDSHGHLGLNAPDDERLQIRQRYHCAPLRTDGFTLEKKRKGTDENATVYYYGGGILHRIDELLMLNYTLAVPTVQTQYTPSGNTRVSGSFLLSMFRVMIQNGTVVANESDFTPISSLQRADGNLGLFFLLGNGVKFAMPGNDDWYRPTVLIGDIIHRDGAEGAIPTYWPEEAASPLACVEQFQFCKGPASLPTDQNRNCGPLASWPDAVGGASHLFGLKDAYRSPIDAESTNSPGNRFWWFMSIMENLAEQPNEMPLRPSSRLLLSEQQMESEIQVGLHADQWKRDVTHWWSTWLALVQISYAEVARGPRDRSLLPDANILAPANKDHKAMCQNQKMQSRRHSSFSVFGLCFVYIAGALVVIISYTIEPLYARLRRGKSQSLEWVTTDTLHLQALGFQGRGLGTWSRLAKSVPITGPDELLEPFIVDKPDDPEAAMEKKKVELLTSVTSASTAGPPSLDMRLSGASGPRIDSRSNSQTSSSTDVIIPSPTDSTSQSTLHKQPTAESEVEVPTTNIVRTTSAMGPSPGSPRAG